MSKYINANAVIEVYDKYQPTLAINVYEFGEELKQMPTADVVPYSIEDGVVTLDLSGIREKIDGCGIKIYFGSDWGGETDAKIH